LGTLFFLNDLIHVSETVLTDTYSPETISELLLHIPLGILIFKKILPLLPEQQRSMYIWAGISAQIIILLIAFTI